MGEAAHCTPCIEKLQSAEKEIQTSVHTEKETKESASAAASLIHSHDNTKEKEDTLPPAVGTSAPQRKHIRFNDDTEKEKEISVIAESPSMLNRDNSLYETVEHRNDEKPDIEVNDAESPLSSRTSRIPRKKKKYPPQDLFADDDDIQNHDDDDTNVEAMKLRILGRPVVSSYQAHDMDLADQVVDRISQTELNRSLQCTICHDTLFNPISLPCGHSYCRECCTWWVSQSPSPSCPTCRAAVPEGVEWQVNTALRACITAIVGPQTDRQQAAQRAERRLTAGENGGAHSRGYQVIQALQDCPWRARNSESEPTWLIRMRRSIVLDAEDQCRQLAMGVLLKHGSDLSLVLLSMEEDEAEEGFPWIISSQDSDNAELICRGEIRFRAQVEVKKTRSDATSTSSCTPITRRAVDKNGVVRFSWSQLIPEDSNSSNTLCFRHEETGALLDLEVSASSASATTTERTPIPERKTVAKQKKSSSFFFQEEVDADEEDAMHGDNTYEDDGFVVGDDEIVYSDSNDENDDNENCCLCDKSDEEELLVCDGGDALDGCGRCFHLVCVHRTQVPPGDWVCQDCAQTFGLHSVGKEGYEFVPAHLKRKRADTDDDIEFSQEPVATTNRLDDDADGAAFSSAVESGNEEESGDDIQAASRKKPTGPVAKRARVVLDDDDDDE